MSEDFVYGDKEADGFFSFFGDSDGNRTVNVLDLLELRQCYGTFSGDPNYHFYMDFNASGSVNILDLLPFRQRYLQTIPFTFGSVRSMSGTVRSLVEPASKVQAAGKLQRH